jgi:ketosteroid isomerase-like protein
MSQKNVEIVRPIYDASAEGTFGSHMDLFDPEIEHAQKRSEADLLVGEWRGIEAMAATIGAWMDTVEDLRIEAERFIDAGIRWSCSRDTPPISKASRMPFEERFADVITLRDGRIVRWHVYRHRAQALEAVGLSE